MVNNFPYKTQPFAHQEAAFLAYRDKEYHAHLWEQRCGKSKVTIDTAAWLYMQGQIKACLVIAPNGVHLNWHRNEVPVHCPDCVNPISAAYVSQPNAAQKKELDKFYRGSQMGLRFFAMHIDALNTEKGLEVAKKFLQAHPSMLVIDEGSIIKNLDAERTKKLIGFRGKLGLGKYAKYRRLLNGTPVTQSPLDIFPQFLFLDDSIFGTSFVTFKNRYAEIEMNGKIFSRINRFTEKLAAHWNTYPYGQPVFSEQSGVILAGSQALGDDTAISFTLKYAGRAQYKIEWQRGPQSGSTVAAAEPGDLYPNIKGFRNLDELQKKIAPHSDRVVRADVFDQPPKVYQKRYVELSHKQEKMYKELRKHCLTEAAGRRMTASLAVTKMLRLQQIIGGFYVPDLTLPQAEGGLFDDWVEMVVDRKAIAIEDKCPRVEAMVDDIKERLQGKIIIWARFVPEIELIQKRLSEEFGPCSAVFAYGAMSADERQDNIRRFQHDDQVRFLVANPACKGVSRGQNLSVASWELYYSNSFALEDRLQSEDRPCSYDQQFNLGIIDYVAPDTMDEKVIQALRDKQDVANQVTGDSMKEWI